MTVLGCFAGVHRFCPQYIAGRGFNEVKPLEGNQQETLVTEQTPKCRILALVSSWVTCFNVTQFRPLGLDQNNSKKKGRESCPNHSKKGGDHGGKSQTKRHTNEIPKDWSSYQKN